MPLAYLASPYSHAEQGVMEMRYREACAAAAELMRDGRTVFSPIAHSHSVAVNGGLELRDLDFWMKQDMAILRHCDELIVLCINGWRQSKGVHREIEWAQQSSVPVKYMRWWDSHKFWITPNEPEGGMGQ